MCSSASLALVPHIPTPPLHDRGSYRHSTQALTATSGCGALSAEAGAEGGRVNQYVCLGDLKVSQCAPLIRALIRGCSGAALGFKTDDIKTFPQNHGFQGETGGRGKSPKCQEASQEGGRDAHLTNQNGSPASEVQPSASIEATENQNIVGTEHQGARAHMIPGADSEEDRPAR
jgi:hypothetical protein